MSKRVVMLAPFDVITGNVSGKQELEYPTNNNRAYDAPVGKTSYAQNYKPRFVISQRKRDGRAYFSVRTKSAIGLTAKQKHNLAVQGGSFAVYAHITQWISLLPYLLAEFQKAKENGYTGTMRAYYSPRIREMIVEQNNNFFIYAEDGSIATTVNNPWIEGLEGFSDEVLAKFWSELAPTPIVFKVGDKGGIAHLADTFGTLAAAYYNTLDLKTGHGTITVDGDEVPGAVYQELAETDEVLVLKNGENFVTDSDTIVAGKTYTLVRGSIEQG